MKKNFNPINKSENVFFITECMILDFSHSHGEHGLGEPNSGESFRDLPAPRNNALRP